LFDVSFMLTENTDRLIAQIECASEIGNLMYVMHCTRLNIAFTVCKFSKYTSNPSMDYWKTIIKVLGYLKKTTHFELYYNNFPIVLEGYTDASQITSAGDNKSTFRWVFILGGEVVSWAWEK